MRRLCAFPPETATLRRSLGVAGLMMLMAVPAFAQSEDRVRISIDASEADAALLILDTLAAGQPVPEADWQALWATRPYQRLKTRETSFKVGFTDDDFRAFLTRGDTVSRAGELRHTLEGWKKADLRTIADHLLAYLPPRATIRATLYPVIKPRSNTFVWELQTDPAIFFYLDPTMSGPKFENTAAHELHHVGLQSIGKEMDAAMAGLPPNAKRAADWMGAFGEGFAMLAAAGSPDVDPHATSTPEDRERWRRDIANFDADLRTVEAFFRDILEGKLSDDQARERGMEFFGVQGPWYTVGYTMAATVEKQLGRQALLRCMEDPRRLLATWNLVAGTRARWSDAVLKAVQATPVTIETIRNR